MTAREQGNVARGAFSFCALIADGDGYDTELNSFGELLKGITELQNVTLNETFDETPEALQWNGSYLSVADRAGNTIDEFSLKGHIPIQCARPEMKSVAG